MTMKTLREIKKESLRQQLIDVAFDLFKKKGFDNVTINEITDIVGISQRSFFRYFPTKEALVLHDQPRRDELIRSILTAGGDAIPPFERIKHCIALVGTDYQNNRDVVLAELSIVAGSPYLKAIDLSYDLQLEALFVQCLRTYRGRQYLARRQAMLAGSALFGVLRVLVWEWIGRGAKHSPQGAIRDGIRFVDGLACSFQPVERTPRTAVARGGKSIENQAEST